MKNITCAILTVSTILTASTSAVLAQEARDVGNVQNNVQTSVTTGDNNATLQQSRQVNKMYRRNGAGGNDVNVQDSDQFCDTLGNGNACGQESVQRNTVRRNGRRNSNPSYGDDD